MDNSNPVATKHYHSFWPLTIILVLAVIAGGLILWASFNQQLDEELFSLVPGVHRTVKSPAGEKSQVQKAPALPSTSK